MSGRSSFNLDWRGRFTILCVVLLSFTLGVTQAYIEDDDGDDVIRLPAVRNAAVNQVRSFEEADCFELSESLAFEYRLLGGFLNNNLFKGTDLFSSNLKDRVATQVGPKFAKSSRTDQDRDQRLFDDFMAASKHFVSTCKGRAAAAAVDTFKAEIASFRSAMVGRHPDLEVTLNRLLKVVNWIRDRYVKVECEFTGTSSECNIDCYIPVGDEFYRKNTFAKLKRAVQDEILDYLCDELPKEDITGKFDFKTDILLSTFVGMTNDGCSQLQGFCDETATYFFDDAEGSIYDELIFGHGRRYREIAEDAIQTARRHHVDITQEPFDSILTSLNLNTLYHVRGSVPEVVNRTRRADSGTLSGGASKDLDAWRAADRYIHNLVSSRSDLGLTELQTINALLRSADPSTHKVRTKSVIVAGKCASMKCTYFAPSEVGNAVDNWISWLRRVLAAAEEISNSARRIARFIEIANDAYMWLVSIHAFDDGNGRTSKMVGDYILLRGGLPPNIWDGNYAIFAGQIIRGTQDPVSWKREVLEKTYRQVQLAVTNWRTHKKPPPPEALTDARHGSKRTGRKRMV